MIRLTQPTRVLQIGAAFLLSLSMTGCVGMQMGSQSAKTTATGSAAGSSSQNVNPALERCDSTLGTLAVVEETASTWYTHLTTDWKLGPTTPVTPPSKGRTNRSIKDLKPNISSRVTRIKFP